jgi:pimeloyl-ACP methyl ester carboxylesterase
VTASTAPPPLLLLHGGGLCGGVFDPVVDALAGRARCMAPDLRGHGHRPATARREDLGVAAQSEDVIALLDDAGIERTAALGHSYGGAVLLKAAIDHPDRFGPLLLHEPALGNPLDPPEEAEARGRAYQGKVGNRRSQWASADEMYDHLRSWRPYGEFADEFLRALVRSGSRPTEGGGVELACDPATEAELFVLTLDLLGGNGLIPQLPRLLERDDPITLTVGTLNKPRLALFEEYGRRLRTLPVKLPGAHFALFASVETTLELVREHLGIGRQA